MAELENRIIARINGTYVRTSECELREQLMQQRMVRIKAEVKSKNRSGVVT